HAAMGIERGVLTQIGIGHQAGRPARPQRLREHPEIGPEALQQSTERRTVPLVGALQRGLSLLGVHPRLLSLVAERGPDVTAINPIAASPKAIMLGSGTA